MSDYTIRLIQNTEFDLLIPLMKDCFGMNVNLEYFEWKFVKNPAGFVKGFIAFAEDGEVAAYYGVIPEIYKIGSEIITIYQSCDTMTHSKHRRKGLFQKLALRCYEYLRDENKLFVIGFGGEKSTPGLLKFGWEKIFDVRYYFYPKFFVRLKRTSRKKRVYAINNYADIESVILQSNNQFEVHSHKTLKVFNWRLANPLYQYKVIAFKSDLNDKQYDSYLSYYTLPDKIMLFDFYFHNFTAGKALIGHVSSLLSNSDYKGIVAFCQENSLYSKALRELGFLTNPFYKGPLSDRPPFLFYASTDEMKKYNKAVQWTINSFDHDAM